MSENNKYDWVEFYKELSGKLLAYKSNRQELISKVKQIFLDTGINMPTLEKGNQLVDIDPFTVFGLFNKSKMTEANRVKIITAIKRLFNVLLWLMRNLLLQTGERRYPSILILPST